MENQEESKYSGMKIFNEELKQIHYTSNYRNLVYTLNFNNTNLIDINFDFVPELREHFKINHYIYIEKHTFIITYINIYFNNLNEEILNIQGIGLNGLLAKRTIFTPTRETPEEGEPPVIETVPLNTAIDTLLNENFIAPTDIDRQIPNLRITSNDITPDVIITEGFELVDKIMVDLTTQAGCGYDIVMTFSGPKYEIIHFDFFTYTTKDTDIVLSRTWNTIIEQDYTLNINEYKNVMYIDDMTTHVGSGVGMRRAETSITGKSEEEAQIELDKLKVFEGVQVEIDPNYPLDINVGDLVLVKDINLGYAFKNHVVAKDIIFEGGARRELVKL